jgi:hypothetical protein
VGAIPVERVEKMVAWKDTMGSRARHGAGRDQNQEQRRSIGRKFVFDLGLPR